MHNNKNNNRSVTTKTPYSAYAKTWQLSTFFTGLLLLAGCQSTASTDAPTRTFNKATSATYSVTKYEESDNTATHDWEARIHPLFERASVLVSNHTGVDLSDVTLNVANENSISAEVGYETHRLIHSQFDNKEFANLFLDSVMRAQRGTFAALYATRNAQVMISMPLMQSYTRSLPNDAATQENAILALLIHELIHAADDKRYSIHKNRDLNFRASFAQSAAFEGHAQFVTRQICETADCLPGLEALDVFMFGRENPSKSFQQTAESVTRNVLEYSYVEGERFVSALAERPNGDRLIGELLSNPPQDPVQILDPKSFPDNAREQRNQELIQLTTSFNHPWLQAPWKSVETSPLKGVNLRSDSAQRAAAIDGFTRLITSMVALQIYNQSDADLTPIDLTILRTDSDDTAKLFARNLYDNTQNRTAIVEQPKALVKVSSQPEIEPATLYVSKEPGHGSQTYYTIIGVSGANVVQVAGQGPNEALFIDYIDQALVKLSSIRNIGL